MKRLLLLALLLCAPVGAQELAVATSDPTVRLHSTFSGETVTLFGNIEPDLSGAPPQGPFDVAIVVRGPAADRVVREKGRVLGLVVNADQAVFSGLPSYYRVLSSRPLEQIAAPEVLATRLLTLEAQALATVDRTGEEADVFSAQLARLMGEANLYRSDPRGVRFLSPTLYSARIGLPANVPSGSFLAQTFVFRDGEVVAERSQRLFVQKTGFERFIEESARTQPLFYGLATVLLAIFTGWLGGVLFRR